MTNPASSKSQRRIIPKADYPTIVLHWALLVTLIVSFITGMQVAADNPSSTWAQSLRWMLPQGNVIVWHLVSALAFIAIVTGYVAFLWASGVLWRISLNKKWWLMLTTARVAKIRWRAINTLIYWIGFVALIIAFVTGILMDLVPFEASYAISSTIHHYAALSLIHI